MKARDRNLLHPACNRCIQVPTLSMKYKPLWWLFEAAANIHLISHFSLTLLSLSHILLFSHPRLSVISHFSLIRLSLSSLTFLSHPFSILYPTLDSMSYLTFLSSSYFSPIILFFLTLLSLYPTTIILKM